MIEQLDYSQFIVLCVVVNILLVFLIIVGVINIITPKEKGLLIDSQKVGVLIVCIISPLWFISFLLNVNVLYSDTKKLIEKCVDNNITIDSKYDNIIKDIKISRFKESLK